MRKKLTSFFTALLVMGVILFPASYALAADPAGVERVPGTTAESSELIPDLYGTISIDSPKLNIVHNNYEFTSEKGLFEIGTIPNSYKEDYGVSINYKNTIPANSDTLLDETLKIKFPGTATLEDGSTADVLITINNIRLVNKDRDSENPTNDILPGAACFRGNFIGLAYYTTDDAPAFMGMSCDFTLAVTDSQGNVVPGSILFEVVDLDVSDVVVGGFDGPERNTPNDFRESLLVKSGSLSKAYIPETNFLDISGSGSADSATGLRFSSTAGDEGTLNTGFVTLVDNGATFTWFGSSGRIVTDTEKANPMAAGMGTTLFTAKTVHILKCTTTRGGTIEQDLTNVVTSVGETGQITVGDGSTVTYTMKPEEGFELGKVLVDGAEVTPVKNDDGTYTFTFESIKANHKIDVSWDPIVTATSGTGGSISDPGDTTVPTGSNKTYTFTPEPGYTIDTVTVNGEEVTPVDNGDGTWSYELTDVQDPTTIDVQWKRTFTVTFEDGDNGTVEGGDQTDVPEGDYPEGGAAVTPDKGWEFTGTYTYVITKPDGTTETGETDDPTTIPVTGDIVFTPKYDPIVTASSGPGGKISDPGDTTVEKGGSKTYTFTPEPGYEPDVVTVNGKTVTPVDNGDGTWSYTFDKVDEPSEINVTWKKKKIPVKFIDSITGKTIDLQEVNYGDPAKAPAAPSHPGYVFKGWDITFDNITKETIVRAIYEPLKGTAKTGDDTDLTLLYVILIISAVAAISVLFIKKKKNKSDQ